MNLQEEKFGEGWQTRGWSQVGTGLVEVGSVPEVKCSPAPREPDIPIEVLEEFFQSLETW